MVLLVTGGAGFIGSNFILYQLKKHPEDRIICLDKLTYAGNLETLKDVKDNHKFRFIKADICDKEAVAKAFSEENPDIVINFAAESHVDRSINDTGIFMQTNIIGTQILLDACRKHGIRFHQISTDEVYGDLPIEETDLFFSENTNLSPSSPYSASKASADLITLSYYKTYRLPVTITRCSNNYGSYQYPEKLIPLTILSALENKPVPVYGNGRNVRDWIYVEDHCKAVDLVIRNGEAGEIYNIGGSSEKSNIEVVSKILEIMDKPKSLITYVPDRPGHDRRYAVDYSKIEKELLWQPETDFEYGLEKTVEWYIQNEDWLKSVKK
ncbi:MAG: dTDP-glucose 4,6-dehydratase [Eubacterium sp.]|nr:dTDP-glucose 4,6-dehydratase [Eubacterium sp.]